MREFMPILMLADEDRDEQFTRVYEACVGFEVYPRAFWVNGMELGLLRKGMNETFGNYTRFMLLDDTTVPIDRDFFDLAESTIHNAFFFDDSYSGVFEKAALRNMDFPTTMTREASEDELRFWPRHFAVMNECVTMYPRLRYESEPVEWCGEKVYRATNENFIRYRSVDLDTPLLEGES